MSPFLTLEMPFVAAVTTFDAQVESIQARLQNYLGDDADPRPTEQTIASAARVLESLGNAHIVYDYAFGHDGSIGVHVIRNDRQEYLDFLNDGRIRYYSTYADGRRLGQIVSSYVADEFLRVYCTATIELTFESTTWVAAALNGPPLVAA